MKLMKWIRGWKPIALTWAVCMAFEAWPISTNPLPLGSIQYFGVLEWLFYSLPSMAALFLIALVLCRFSSDGGNAALLQIGKLALFFAVCWLAYATVWDLLTDLGMSLLEGWEGAGLMAVMAAQELCGTLIQGALFLAFGETSLGLTGETHWRGALRQTLGRWRAGWKRVLAMVFGLTAAVLLVMNWRFLLFGGSFPDALASPLMPPFRAAGRDFFTCWVRPSLLMPMAALLSVQRASPQLEEAEKTALRAMARWLGLVIVTLGIYFYVWVYSITKRAQGEANLPERKSPGWCTVWAVLFDKLYPPFWMIGQEGALFFLARNRGMAFRLMGPGYPFWFFSPFVMSLLVFWGQRWNDGFLLELMLFELFTTLGVYGEFFFRLSLAGLLPPRASRHQTTGPGPGKE